MKCTDASAAMLECELAELSPRGTSLLSQHIAACSECLARAEAIALRTDALRVAVLSRRAGGAKARARHHSRRVGMIGALLVAASLFLFVTLRDKSPSADVATQSRRPPVRVFEQGTITIDDAQGRAVSIRRGQDTVDVVFHQPVTND